MHLHSTIIGSGQPLIILHGLYGSSENWLTHGRELAKQFEVHLVDQRNHAQSPHSDEHNYAAMEADLLEYMDFYHLERAIIMGHSMGGKTAMFFSISNPERISSLIVVDMSPLGYNKTQNSKVKFHTKVFEGLMSINLKEIKHRSEAEKQLKKYVPSIDVCRFLLKNISRNPESKQFEWKLNLHGLYESLDNIMEGIDPDMVSPLNSFPVLFIRGPLSGYIRNEDIDAIRQIYPYAEIENIPDTGHWLHAEKPEEFLSILNRFLN